MPSRLHLSSWVVLAPILLSLPLHGGGGGVFELEPVWRAARVVARPEPLRHDALDAHLAGVCKHQRAVVGMLKVSFRRTPGRLLRRMLASVALRTSIGSRRMSVPFSSSRSKAKRKARASFRRWRSVAKMARPRSSQHTTSPSIRQERTFRWFTASTMSG